MVKIIAFILALVTAAPAVAAPTWLDRRAAPRAALLDPVFAEADQGSTLTIDNRLWSDFLAAYVVDGGIGASRVRYAAVSAGDREALASYIASLEAVDPARLSRAEQLAYWINLYNAATVRLIIEHPNVKSIRAVRKPWGIPVATVKGRALSLNAIEHGIIRPVFRDARIHYAVNCASLGCPDLSREPYAGDRLDAQLDRAARRYVNSARGVVAEKGRVTASKIYAWYAGDFGGADPAVLDHLRRYADPPLRDALSAARKIDAYQYDWSLNLAP